MLEEKKRRLEKTRKSLIEEADDTSEKAEKNMDFTLLSKSNALRERAKSISTKISLIEKDMAS